MGSKVVIIHGGHFVYHHARLYCCWVNVHSLEPPPPWKETPPTPWMLGFVSLLWAVECELIWHMGPKFLEGLHIYGRPLELLLSTRRTKFYRAWRLLVHNPRRRSRSWPKLDHPQSQAQAGLKETEPRCRSVRITTTCQLWGLGAGTIVQADSPTHSPDSWQREPNVIIQGTQREETDRLWRQIDMSANLGSVT